MWLHLICELDAFTCWVIWLILWYYLIYTLFYFESADDIYLIPVFCTDPYLYVFLLLFVECSKRAVVFNSTATLASLHRVSFQGELLFLARTGFSLIHVLMSLKFRHGLSLVFVFSFLDILRSSNLRIDVLVMMTPDFGDNDKFWVLEVDYWFC